MPLDDPIVEFLLEDLDEQIAKLLPSQSEELSEVSLPKRKKLVGEICQIIRDIRFNLGAPTAKDPEQWKQVVSEFKRVAEVIDAACDRSDLPEEVRSWGQSVNERALRLEDWSP